MLGLRNQDFCLDLKNPKFAFRNISQYLPPLSGLNMLPPLAGWIRFHGSKANRMTDGSVFSVNEAEARAGGERCKVEIFSHLPRSTFCP